MPSAQIIELESSAAFLPGEGALRRRPRAPGRKRPEAFWAAFEDRALVYDCFRSADGSEIVLACPPPCTLLPQWEAARFTARPSGKPLTPRLHISRSTMTATLTGAPEGTTGVTLTFEGQNFDLPVRPNLAEAFAGRRVMFTMNKDNDLAWIALWADWHAKLHGVDAIVVFDNASTRYAPSDIETTLAAIPGMKTVAVPSWPYRYGPVDPAVLFHPYWANFLQVASFRTTVSRLAPKAQGILNCDIDELVGGPDAFAALAGSPDGLVMLKGTWVETAIAPEDARHAYHLRYRYRHKNRLKSICANKWLIDPQRPWAQDPAFTPMMHRIYGLSKSTSRRAPALPFFHFQAINTNWKEERNMTQAHDAGGHTRLRNLDEQVERYLAGSESI
ncbi:hypothetical protein [Pelagibacterium xiamenense]|uniref:hypothetical protein n=1 Tax=Pelagibacterium xiamenense TaxID=2901140 RepID=UPI001E4918DA|nr:hypothetical protein [Pelagibacterium xiamenense]MCD7058740.1 hypothetical protein [Pelagibacterium xiamenense]